MKVLKSWLEEESGPALAVVPAERDAAARMIRPNEFIRVRRDDFQALVELTSRIIRESSLDGITSDIFAIQSEVAEHYHISFSELLSKSRLDMRCWPRMVAIYFCSRLTSRPTTTLAAVFGLNCHTTIRHAIRRVEARIQTEQSVAVECSRLELALKRRLGRN